MNITPFITYAQAIQKVQELNNRIQSQMNGITSGHYGHIKIADVRTKAGIYSPTEVGVYIKAGNLTFYPEGIDEGKLVQFIFDGETWVKNVVVVDGMGMGSGFYNVTAEHPLDEGEYHTVITAVQEMQRVTITDIDKTAIIITFEVEDGVWAEYRFIGNVATEFGDNSKWIAFAPNVEQEYDPTSTNPISSKGISDLITDLKSNLGASVSLKEIGEGVDKKFAINLLDADGNIISTTDEFSGGGGGVGSSTNRIALTKITENLTVKLGDDVDVSFKYDHIETEFNTSTGIQGTATVTIISGATTNEQTLTLNAGSTTTIPLGRLLLVGNNTIRVRVEVDNGETTQVSLISWSILAVNLVLTSSYNYASIIEKGTTAYIPFTLNGSGNKSLDCYVDGVLFESRSVSTSSSNGSFTIPTTGFFHGNVSIQLVAELETPDGFIRSNSIYYDLGIGEVGINEPIVTTRFNYSDGKIIGVDKRPQLQARQLENFRILYGAYDPLRPNKLVEVRIGDELINSAMVDFVQTEIIHGSNESGIFPSTITIDDYVYHFEIDIQPSSIDLTEPVDNLVFKLSARSKSNGDIGREVWESTHGDISATLEGVKFGGDGWGDNALKLTDNGRAIINYKPLNSQNATTRNSWTFQTRLKTTEVVNQDANVIECIDFEGTGFVVTPSEIKMVTKGKAEVTMKLSSGEAYNLAFVSYPFSDVNSSYQEKLNHNMVYLYINGIISGAVQRSNTDDIYQAEPMNITLGANGATTTFNMIRHYNRYLSDEEALNLYLLDLDDIDTTIQKFNENAIIDGDGNITVDNIPDDMLYVIITGQASNGLSTLMNAAVLNNKNSRYDIDEMLYIKNSEPHNNFKLIGGCIRLQGTSSLAYPIKNYRMYLKDSSKKYGKLYVGVDRQGNGGELQEGDSGKGFSFKASTAKGKRPYPVDMWCMKADYAESSGASNTGMAKIINDSLVDAGMLTPAQKHVIPTHPYEVRTTIDGEPCYLFYRNSISDTPRFLGKFNFNNDESSEKVYGFEDVPGYHLDEDGNVSDWIVEKFDGINPTECWEFQNNDYPMGSFLESDFDAMVDLDGELVANWTRVFEARYPDNDDFEEAYENGTKRPFYLERLVKWVTSTKDNPQKFKDELHEYLDIDFLADFYMITDMFASVDQRIKNCFIGFWYNLELDKMIGYYIFYDMDTVMGVRNDGRLKYGFDIDHNTIDPELSVGGLTSYAFMGHDSVLWENLRTQFKDKLQESYRRLRARMTNDDIFRVFDKEQSDKFVERAYNVDAQNKYVLPRTIGVESMANGVVSNSTYSYLESLQGSRKSHRHWWITNRMAIFDARYDTGLYSANSLEWKGFSEAGATIRATSSRDYHFQVKRESTIMTHQEVKKGVEFTYTYPNDANIGTIFRFYGGEFASKIDMSDWGGFTDLNLPTFPAMTELILGNETKTYSLSEMSIGDKFPMLTKLDITNYNNIPSFDLSLSTRLEEFIAKGCDLMNTVRFALGCPISRMVLPKNLRTLQLENLSELKNTGIEFPDGMGIDTLIVDNCEQIDYMALIDTIGSNLTHIRITGIDLTEESTYLNQFNHLGGVNSEGGIISGVGLVGKFQLIDYVEASELRALRDKFPLLEITQSEYSTYIVYDKNPTGGSVVLDTANIYNPHNDTGYTTSRPYVASGHILDIKNSRHRYLGKQAVDGEMTVIQLHDEDSGKYNDHVNKNSATTAKLDGSEGDVWVMEPHYWYRGVTDHYNRITYAMYSGNTQKPKPPIGTKKYTYNELFEMGHVDKDRYALDGHETLLESRGYSDNHNLIKVPVKGYSKMKFPVSVRTLHQANLQCSLFTNEDGDIIKRLVYNMEDISAGSDIIEDIPEGAEFLYLTMVAMLADYEFNITMSNSDNVIDLEPDWVRNKPTLISPFKTSLIGGRNYRSTATNPAVYPNIALDIAEEYVKRRNFRSMDNRDFTKINNIMLFNVGDRNLGNYFGYDTSTSTNGLSVEKGMADTTNPNFPTQGSALYKTGVDGTGQEYLGVCSTFGYENLYTTKIVSLDDAPRREIWGTAILEHVNGYTENEEPRMVFTSNYNESQYPRYIRWGKYLDRTSMGTATGSDSSFYPDFVAFSSVGSQIYMAWNTDLQTGAYYMNTTSTTIPSSLFRLAFDRTIRTTTNLNYYRGLVDVNLK